MIDDLEIGIARRRKVTPEAPVEKIVDDEGRYKEYYCPYCGRNIGLSDKCKCGQLIDWGF